MRSRIHLAFSDSHKTRIGSWIADYAIHACMRIFLIVAINFASTRRRKYLHVKTYARILENSQGFTDSNHIYVSLRTILVVTVIISTGFISNLLGSFLNLRIHRPSKITRVNSWAFRDADKCFWHAILDHSHEVVDRFTFDHFQIAYPAIR